MLDSVETNIIEFSLISSDIREVSADVLVLKYAQKHYGVSSMISECLEEHGEYRENMMPYIGKHALVTGRNCTQFNQILWMGVPHLMDFGYDQIKQFSYSSLEILKDSGIQSIAYTIHGAGYGLDEKASFASQISGIQEALKSGQYPHSLKHIYLVESNYHRFRSICEMAGVLLADYKETHCVFRLPTFSPEEPIDHQAVPHGDMQKQSHVFVAMPFDPAMDDVFYYGIQEPVHTNKLLCERIDNSIFTGDILVRIKQRIETAFLVVADLSGMNPNVYLEVGYAWGVGKSVILIAKEECAVKFDVQGQKRIIYRSIRDLAQQLSHTISCLKDQLDINKGDF